MKRFLLSLVLSLLPTIALAQTSYNQFSPGGALSGTWNSQNVALDSGSPFITGTLPVANGGTGVATLTGLVKANGISPFTAATVSDILGLFTGTCDATHVLFGGGACGLVSLTGNVSGILPVANGGSGASSFTANDVLLGNGSSPFNELALGADTFLQGTGSAPQAGALTNCVGSTSALNYSTGTHTFSCQTISVGTGTITGVTITVPSWLTVSGSPCTSGNCSFAVTAASGQTANEGLFSPNGSSGALAVRALVPADIPQINLSCSSGNGCITGILGVPNGGTGTTSATGSGSLVLAISPTLATPTINTGALTFSGSAAQILLPNNYSSNNVTGSPSGTNATPQLSSNTGSANQDLILCSGNAASGGSPTTGLRNNGCASTVAIGHQGDFQYFSAYGSPFWSFIDGSVSTGGFSGFNIVNSNFNGITIGAAEPTAPNCHGFTPTLTGICSFMLINGENFVIGDNANNSVGLFDILSTDNQVDLRVGDTAPVNVINAVAVATTNSSTLKIGDNTQAASVTNVVGGSAANTEANGHPILTSPTTTIAGQCQESTATAGLGQWAPCGILSGFTVSTLPTCNGAAEGQLAYVTDATNPTYNGALTGGGSIIVPVFCNGTSWTSH